MKRSPAIKELERIVEEAYSKHTSSEPLRIGISAYLFNQVKRDIALESPTFPNKNLSSMMDETIHMMGAEVYLRLTVKERLAALLNSDKELADSPCDALFLLTVEKHPIMEVIAQTGRCRVVGKKADLGFDIHCEPDPRLITNLK